VKGKKILRKLFYGPLRRFAMFFRPIPSGVIAFFIVNIVRILAISRSPKDGLRMILTIEKELYRLTGEEALRYGGGVHTKHHHIGYHDFFCSRLRSEEHVLDIGCGNGELAYDMAEKAGAVVTGIELSERNYRQALNGFSHPKITYIHGDVLKDLPDESFDVAVMSNVLEHLSNRVEFLKSAQKVLRPKRWLLRVPLYERDWRVPLMEELSIDYRLDSTHYTEYTQESFAEEMKQAGFEIVYREVRWGEIWSEVKLKDDSLI